MYVFFPDLKLFSVQHKCFWFQNKQLRKHKCWSRGGLQQTFFVINLCFAECEKLSFFGGAPFLANFG